MELGKWHIFDLTFGFSHPIQSKSREKLMTQISFPVKRVVGTTELSKFGCAHAE